VAGAITKQEIRRNLLAEWLGAAIRLVQARRTTVLAAVGAIAVLGGAGGGYWWYHERQEAEASHALAGAYAVLRGEQAGKPETQEEAIREFQAVVAQHRGTRAAEEGLIAVGNLQYEGGKADAALASYSEYLTAYPRGRFRLMAALGKAYAQEAKGDLQGAAQTLSEALDRDTENPLAGEAYISLARVYEGLKKSEDAMRIYGQVVERFNQTNWAQLALQRMTVLKAK
jgi:TolA-binding protein